MWGPKARGWVTDEATGYHGVLFNEVHEADLTKAIRHFRKAKMLADGAKATATGLGGNSGGALVAVQLHLKAWFKPPSWAPSKITIVRQQVL